MAAKWTGGWDGSEALGSDPLLHEPIRVWRDLYEQDDRAVPRRQLWMQLSRHKPQRTGHARWSAVGVMLLMLKGTHRDAHRPVTFWHPLFGLHFVADIPQGRIAVICVAAIVV